MNSRDETLALLRGERIARVPVFSGLPSLTASGLRAAGVRYSEAHTDVAKMAAAAASTFELFGFESAVVPFDLCVEAEALGCGVDFQTDVDIFLAPVVDKPLKSLAKARSVEPSQGLSAGRIPLVADAIRKLKTGVGREIAIGAWVPGPFTLAWQMFGADAWLSALSKPIEAESFLDTAVDFLTLVARYYRKAGADFITVHEMGGSPQVIGASKFRQLVKPALKKLFAATESPKVLNICGDTNTIVRDLAACGADALSFDHRNDFARTRRLLGADAILFGNFDPVGVLSHGTPDQVTQSIAAVARAGANAIWPGCDLYPEIPDENMRALMESARRTTKNK